MLTPTASILRLKVNFSATCSRKADFLSLGYVPSCSSTAPCIFFKIIFFFKVFIFRERGREGEREGEEHHCEKHWPVASGTRLDRGPNLQPRHVPWPVIKPPALALWDDTRPSEPLRSGLSGSFSIGEFYDMWTISQCSYYKNKLGIYHKKYT